MKMLVRTNMLKIFTNLISREFGVFCVKVMHSTPKKAVILPLEEQTLDHHCLICGILISSDNRLSIFGRSKLDLKGAISQLLKGDLQITADQEHFICKTKCLSRVRKYLKLSSDLAQLSHELKQEILARNSVRIKRREPPISPISPIKPISTTTDTTQRKTKEVKKSLFPSQTIEGTTARLVKPISTPLFVPFSSQQCILPLSSDNLTTCTTISHLTPAILPPITQDFTATSLHQIEQPIKNQDHYVQVLLNYPGCEKKFKAILKEDLQPLGKALARKVSYQKICTAIFRSKDLKDCVIKKILANLKKECIGLCSKKEPSILRSKDPEEMQNFTLSKVNDEFKRRAPLFYSFLISCANSGDKDEPMPSVAVAGSVLLRQRNVHMNATQSLISLMIKQNGVQKLLNRLNLMKLSLSSKSILKRLDTYGVKFEEEQAKVKTNTSENPPNTTTDAYSSASRNEDIPNQECNSSYKIVLDNIDLKILVRDMTAERQNKDIHWCNHMAVQNRAVNQQSNIEQTELLELDNSKILPEARDNQLLRRDFIQLVARVLVEHLPCFHFLTQVCPKHIPHQYSKEMAEKSEKIPLGVLFKSENNNEEMVEILSEIQGYSNMQNKTTIPVVGDQLTVERGVNIIEALQNSYTPEERLEGVHMEVADWHSVVTFLKVIFNRHYSASSDADKGTLYANRNVINRRNVISDVHSAWAPCKTFMLLDLNARVIAAAMNLLDMKKLDQQPKNFVISEELKNAPDLVKQIYLQKLCVKIVDTFIIDQDIQKDLMDKVLLNQEQEDIFHGQTLTADGRYVCRHEGCTKSFKFDGKSKKKHEMTHNIQPKPKKISALTSKYPEKLSTNKPDTRDDAYNYNCSLLNHGLLFMNFLDATAEGDGARLMRCWKFFLLHFKHEKSTYKYALEALYLQFQVQALLPPAQAFNLIHNRTVNNRGGPGKNVSLDLDLEHENNYLKQNIKGLGPNVAPASVKRICRAQKVTQTVLSNFDNECAIKKKIGKHVAADYSKDLKAIIDVLVQEAVCTFTPERHYFSFPKIKRDPISALDMSNMYKWINMHKTNIDLGRKAR